MKITPVILSGGAGTRLWPLSRNSFPKQFSHLMGDRSLFQEAVLRVRRAQKLNFADPVIVTSSDFRFIVTEQLFELGVDPGAIILEPMARNTAPAILAAALRLAEEDPQAIMLVMPSDHRIEEAGAFHSGIATGLEAMAEGKLVTFGVIPQRAETGYGYLELLSGLDESGGAMALSRFVEKPDAAQAQSMIESGNYLWNAGIYLFSAKDIIAAFEAHAPAMVGPVREAVAAARADLGFLRLASEPWARVEDISIDYAVMERADNLAVVPFAGAWADLGGWDAVWRESGADADGVVSNGHVTALDCENTLLHAGNENLELVGVGLSNIFAVAMQDAVLVADMGRAQDVKLALERLKEKGARQASEFPTQHRPWGWFERLASGARFQVKRIVVHPGAALSLQSHLHRAEHWIVVEGTAKVTIDGIEKLVTENQSVYVPLGAIHRLENPGKVAMVLVEVQTGAYVGEDDIVRYADDYARVAETGG